MQAFEATEIHVGKKEMKPTPLVVRSAAQGFLALLDALIAGTTDAEVLKELDKARKALVGKPEAENGALRMIRDSNDDAAIAFLQQAADRLRAAGAAGADTATLVALLEQVVAALSAP